MNTPDSEWRAVVEKFFDRLWELLNPKGDPDEEDWKDWEEPVQVFAAIAELAQQRDDLLAALKNVRAALTTPFVDTNGVVRLYAKAIVTIQDAIDNAGVATERRDEVKHQRDGAVTILRDIVHEWEGAEWCEPAVQLLRLIDAKAEGK